jgi:hypothetical protein
MGINNDLPFTSWCDVLFDSQLLQLCEELSK